MSRVSWQPAVLLLAAAFVLAAPVRVERHRRARVLGTTSPAGVPFAVNWRAGAVRPWPAGPHREGAAARRLAIPVAVELLAVPPVAAVLAGAAGLASGGPVAACIAATYAALLAGGLRQRRLGRLRARQRRQALDALCALAAELRAGLPPATITGATAAGPASPGGALATGAASASGSPAAGAGRVGGVPPTRDGDHAAPAPAGGDRLGALAAAAVRLADTTGAPLADLVERIEADGRASDRAAASAEAQAAGVRATAWLLAVLPVGGIALGYGVGADPLNVLLHTPIGAGCAVLALLLQVTGLAWVERLARIPGGAS